MGVSTPDLQRLAEHVADRRNRLGMSVRRAAGVAGVSKDTWTRLEAALPVRHSTYDAAELALGWTAGSCRKIADGGDALLLEDAAESATSTTSVPPETLEVEIRDAVQGALIASTDELTTSQIREVNEHAIAILRARGILPPKD